VPAAPTATTTPPGLATRRRPVAEPPPPAAPDEAPRRAAAAAGRSWETSRRAAMRTVAFGAGVYSGSLLWPGRLSCRRCVLRRRPLRPFIAGLGLWIARRRRLQSAPRPSQSVSGILSPRRGLTARSRVLSMSLPCRSRCCWRRPWRRCASCPPPSARSAPAERRPRLHGSLARRAASFDGTEAKASDSPANDTQADATAGTAQATYAVRPSVAPCSRSPSV
jgi:hypothetical protein